MDDAKHTPGPWAITCERDRQGAFNNIGAPAQEWPNSEIGLVSCDNEQFKANSRLIAAAPDYDDAARAYVLWCENFGDDIPENMRRAMELAFGHKLRAALTKARGAMP